MHTPIKSIAGLDPSAERWLLQSTPRHSTVISVPALYSAEMFPYALYNHIVFACCLLVKASETILPAFFQSPWQLIRPCLSGRQLWIRGKIGNVTSVLAVLEVDITIEAPH